MAAIIAFLQALPAFIQILGDIASLMNRFIAWNTQNNINGWIDDLESHMTELEGAKDAKTKLDALAKLANSISNI